MKSPSTSLNNVESIPRRQFGLRMIFALFAVFALHCLLARFNPVLFVCVVPSSVFFGFVARRRHTTRDSLSKVLIAGVGYATLSGLVVFGAIAVSFIQLDNDAGTTFAGNWLAVILVSIAGAIYALASTSILAGVVALAIGITSIGNDTTPT